jgi:prophage regulatory protein
VGEETRPRVLDFSSAVGLKIMTEKMTNNPAKAGFNIQSTMDKPVFLRRRAVEGRTGLSTSSIYDRIAAGQFPKPVPLGGRSVGWLESEIVEWQKARIAERARKTMLGARGSAQ